MIMSVAVYVICKIILKNLVTPVPPPAAAAADAAAEAPEVQLPGGARP